MPDPVRATTRLIGIQATPFGYALSSAHDVSPLERIMRLREKRIRELVEEVWSVATVWSACREGPDDEADEDLDPDRR